MSPSVSKDKSTLVVLFGDPGLFYVDIFNQIAPHLTTHKYHFFTEESLSEYLNSEHFTVALGNQILSLELIEKAHLAATVALYRTKQWIETTCLSYENHNFIAWAAGTRGLIESTGDILDGLLNVPLSLATHHAVISKGLAGRASEAAFGFSEIEHELDHFVLAHWMRAPKGEVRKAKDNAEYVQALEPSIPRVVEFYRRLCGITHPSSASVEYLYEIGSDGLKVNLKNDRAEIDKMRKKFQDVLDELLYYACNPPLLTLRVLHKFGYHPRLSALKKLDWSRIPGWTKIDRELRG
jgi:hypothetical protein